MSGFRFRAHNAEGKTYRGVIQANSILDAERALARQKLIPDHVKAEPLDRSLRLRRTPASRAMVQFARQFATLIEAAVPLLLSLEILQGLTDDRPLRAAIATTASDVQAGSTLADALRRHPKVFSGIFVAVVEAGEEGGTLDVSLNRLAESMERTQAIRDRVRGAMIYPGVIALTAVGAVVAMLTLVVPTFEGMFAANGMELPFPTLVLVEASRFIADQWALLAVGALFVVLVGRTLYGTQGGRRVAHRLILHVPVLGALLRVASVARMSRTIGSLLDSGVPILDALTAAARAAGNTVIEEAVLRSRDAVAMGFGISGPLGNEPVLPRLMAQMVSVGEQTGRLAQMFEKVADFHEAELDAQVDGLLKTLEPILVVLVGVLLGGMVVAMYLPIFDAIGAVDAVGM